MTLYERVSALHGHRPWGAVLDAGTGRASMRWLLAHIADLRTRALAHIAGEGGLRHGHDYIVVAEPA